jgi:hypothetical protein
MENETRRGWSSCNRKCIFIGVVIDGIYQKAGMTARLERHVQHKPLRECHKRVWRCVTNVKHRNMDSWWFYSSSYDLFLVFLCYYLGNVSVAHLHRLSGASVIEEVQFWAAPWSLMLISRNSWSIFS